jgi:hypothetical protein
VTLARLLLLFCCTVMDSKQRLVWKSSPARNSAAGPFAAVVQNDGLLVVLDARGATVWNSQSVM